MLTYIQYLTPFQIACHYCVNPNILSSQKTLRAGKIRFSSTRKSVFLKTSPGERCAPCDFTRYTCSPHRKPPCGANETCYGKMKQCNNISSRKG